MDESQRAGQGTAAEASKHHEIAAIIARGTHQRPGGWMTLILSLMSALLLWCSFPPLDAGYLAWIAIVPLLVLIRPCQRPRSLYLSTFLGGLAFWLASLQWMRLGDPTMYIAWVALAIYLACYWPLFIALSRTAVHRLGIPFIIAVPVFWVGLEYLRAFLLTGFSWYYLGHTQYLWVEIIQVSDLFGAYAVSFLVACGNAAIAQWVTAEWIERVQLCWPAETEAIRKQTSLRTNLIGLATALSLIFVSWGYGSYRRGQVEFPMGPRVGLVQGNFVASVRSDQDQWEQMDGTHQQLTRITIPYQPDLIVWPEAMYRYPLWDHVPEMTDEQLQEVDPDIPVEAWKNRKTQQNLADLSDMANAALMIGISAFEAHHEGYSVFNSAAFVQPGVGVTGRYDKIHRVPFGEYIPFYDQLPFLQSLTPYRGKFGIDAGREGHVFKYQDWSLIPIICFEDTVPQLVRNLSRAAKVNQETGSILVNMTNDGWFHGSSELDQHLITASFRCVENRTPMVRAVNTGISAVIDGNGVVREPEKFLDLDAQISHKEPRTSMRDPESGRFHKQLNCAIVADVPLDPRKSFYVWFGDWAAFVCLVACAGVALQALLVRSSQQSSAAIQK